MGQLVNRGGPMSAIALMMLLQNIIDTSIVDLGLIEL
jgi:hypothetical protein